MQTTLTRTHPRKKSSPLARQETIFGILFAMPAILGLLLFSVGPILASFGISFTNWSLLAAPEWVGIENYQKMLSDPLVGLSLGNTAKYALMAIPIGLIASLSVAILLNQKVRGQRVFMLAFYLPSILPAVAVTVVWLWLLDPNFGLVNLGLHSLGLPTLGWLSDPNLVMPSFVLMSVWGAGGGAIIFLASLQGVPRELYDAAMVDGAGNWKCFRHITLPMISPVIFFSLITGTIGALQTFTQGYLIGGGRDNAGLFYNLYLYNKAFQQGNMGYAAALAWLLFVIILLLTLLIFRSSSLWVFYESRAREQAS
ncbi:MAG: sugar ABC transporter permease [Anaerolineae bacterium]|nr:sugar ABC transporter permease [Anaerolineae bacterium]